MRAQGYGGAANNSWCKTKNIFKSASGIDGTASSPGYKYINIYMWERKVIDSAANTCWDTKQGIRIIA